MYRRVTVKELGLGYKNPRSAAVLYALLARRSDQSSAKTKKNEKPRRNLLCSDPILLHLDHSRGTSHWTAALSSLARPHSSASPQSQHYEVSHSTHSIKNSKKLPEDLHPSSFPPGPPPSSIDYQVPGSELSIELSSLGLVRDRNERNVEHVLNDAFRASLIPFRPHEPIDDAGYKLYEGGFVLGVAPSSPSSRRTGEKALTWGMWTECLAGIHGYVEAYPRYDFSFDIWLTPSIGGSQGYVIGSGFALTRR